MLFRSNDDRNTFISGVRNIDISDVADRDQGYILAKFSNRSSTGVAGINSTFVDTDFPLFRLADVYLMYAECAARGAAGASLSQAVTYVNALRERANNGSTAANISANELTLDFILDERSREYTGKVIIRCPNFICCFDAVNLLSCRF